jgi:rhamnosyltransferase
MRGDRLSIAAVVVLYHPSPEVLDNILTWSAQVERVFAVDNSESPSSDVIERLTVVGNVIYLPLRQNVGIARALNMGAELAVKDGYDLLLTMDQDSRAKPDMVARLLECAGAGEGKAAGIVAPFHLTRAVRRAPPETDYSEVMTPMTSGCFLSLNAWQEVGPFRDDFFIDFVDNEYCLRLRRNGYRVVRANRAILEHAVGDITRYGPLIATNHSPLRRYYKTRNRFVVFREYLTTFPGHCLFDLVRLVKEIGSIILFEQEKWTKLMMMWQGASDFRHGKMGKFEATP